MLQFVWTHPANCGNRLRKVVRSVPFQIQARVRHRGAQTLVDNGTKMWAHLHRTSATGTRCPAQGLDGVVR